MQVTQWRSGRQLKPFISGGAPGELGGGVNNMTHNCEDVPETESESALLSFPAAEAGEALQLLIEPKSGSCAG
jgi:hypothetical protein